MKYTNVISGVFRRRLNRFIAEVMVNDILEQVHVKNTGRLKELLLEGAIVYLECSSNTSRKTKYSLIAVEKDGRIINIDSQVPNQVVFEALRENRVSELQQLKLLQREVTFGQSRFDLYFEDEQRKGFIEVKGVTLNKNGIAMFPDAPTERGTKHIMEMIEAVRAGFAGYIFFLVQMQGCDAFKPHQEMDPPFAEALRTAAKQGVQILAYDAYVTCDEIEMGKPMEVKL